MIGLCIVNMAGCLVAKKKVGFGVFLFPCYETPKTSVCVCVCVFLMIKKKGPLVLSVEPLSSL